MRQVKAGQPLIDLVELCYAADRPLLLVGKHGVGKSELLEQAAKRLGVGYICRDLSLMEPPDLVGMPYADGDVTRYRPPAFLPREGQKEGKGIIAFEELNRCPRYMMAPTLQLLTARVLNDYRLPPEWLPVASVNPSEGGYDVQELDAALMSRFVKAEVVPDKEKWLEWATKSGVHHKVLEYVGRDSKIFKDTSPRDWKYASDLLKASGQYEGSGQDGKDTERGGKGGAKGPEGGKPYNAPLRGREGGARALRAALAGVLGRERGNSFEAFLKGNSPLPPFLEVLGNFASHIRSLREWMAAGRTDVFDDYVHAAKIHLQSEDNYTKLRNDNKKWKALGQFMGMIPPDQREDMQAFLLERGYESPLGGS